MVIMTKHINEIFNIWTRLEHVELGEGVKDFVAWKLMTNSIHEWWEAISSRNGKVSKNTGSILMLVSWQI